MIKNLSISRKMIFGFVSVLLLLLAISVTGYLSISRSSNDFATYRNYARSANLSGRIQAMVLYARLNFKAYMVANKDKDKDLFNKRIGQMMEFIDEANTDITDIERATRIDTVEVLANLYNNTFKKIESLIEIRDDGVINNLDVIGPKIEKNLSSIMSSAKEDDDMSAAYNAGTGLKHLLLMRLYVTKFLESNSQSAIDRVEREYSLLLNSMNTLDKELQNQGRRSILGEVNSQIKQYYENWDTKVVPSILERNDLINNVMDVAGPRIADEIEQVKLNFKEDQDVLGPKLEAANKASITLIIIVSIVSIALGIFFAYYLIKIITQPINNVVIRLKDIAQGEGDLTVRLDVDSKDELGQLSQWFNTFVEKIQDIISQVVDSTRQIASSSEQISSSSEELAAGAEEQQAQLSEVASSIEEMSSMILQSSNNTKSTEDGANRVMEETQNGRDTVNNTVESIQKIAEIVEKTADQINMLENRSSEIGEVIQVIDDIADQTNLLALNANIEAARAGDAGRGFAVVADEVRKLAERTVNATGEIGSKIKLIQGDVSDSVNAMKMITEQSEDGKNRAAEYGSALNNISCSVEEINDAIKQISRASMEQSTGAEEISKNVESVTTVSRQAASSAQELSASAENLNSELESLTVLISGFKV